MFENLWECLIIYGSRQHLSNFSPGQSSEKNLLNLRPFPNTCEIISVGYVRLCTRECGTYFLQMHLFWRFVLSELGISRLFSILYLLSSHATAARLKRQKSQQKQSFFDFKHILTGRPRPNI